LKATDYRWLTVGDQSDTVPNDVCDSLLAVSVVIPTRQLISREAGTKYSLRGSNGLMDWAPMAEEIDEPAQGTPPGPQELDHMAASSCGDTFA
jgi:hypothetical protein